MRVSAVVMAHPKREQQALRLQDRLGCEVVWDTIDSEWDTGQRALRHNLNADWVCVLQDDAIIGNNFMANLEQAIANVPSRSLISLYTGTVRPNAIQVSNAIKKAQRVNASWLVYKNLLWGVGIVIPAEDIEPMLAYVKLSRKPYDFRIGSYYFHNKRPVYYTFPSLVDHDWKLPTLTKHGNLKRVAHKYSDELMEWNSKVVHV